MRVDVSGTLYFQRFANLGVAFIGVLEHEKGIKIRGYREVVRGLFIIKIKIPLYNGIIPSN